MRESTFGPVVAEHEIEVGMVLPEMFRVFSFHRGDPGQQFQPIDVYLLGVVGSDPVLTSQRKPLDARAVFKVGIVVNARTACNSEFVLAFAHYNGACLA